MPMGACDNAIVPSAHARVILDRPVLLTARAAYPSAANPFEAENYGVPLMLVLHTSSVAEQTGAERGDVELLAALGHSPYADIWLTAGPEALGAGLLQAEAGAGTTDESLTRLPVAIDYAAGLSRFRAHVRGWDRWRQRADDLYSPRDRARVLDSYAGALLTIVANRHAFVTSDSRMLAEREDNVWAEVNILDVREALALVGLLMRQRGRCDFFYDQSGPFERSSSSRFYGELTTTLSSSGQGLFDAVEIAEQLNDATSDLILGADDRLSDLLVSRDEVRVASLLPHGGAMLASALYHLRAAVQTSAALLDSLAVLACEQVAVPSDPLTVTFRRPAFRQALANAGATSLAEIVSSQRYLALAFFINELRGPIGHGRGIHGVTDLSAREVTSHLRISEAQGSKLKQLYGQRHETAEAWGARPGNASIVDIEVFADKLIRTVIEAFDEAASALTADLRRARPGQSRLIQAWQEGQERLADVRIRLPAKEREEIEQMEAEQEEAQLEYERKMLRDIALYGGLADWPLLERLTAVRTCAAGHRVDARE
jgi:hypothetical protein